MPSERRFKAYNTLWISSAREDDQMFEIQREILARIDASTKFGQQALMDGSAQWLEARGLYSVLGALYRGKVGTFVKVEKNWGTVWRTALSECGLKSPKTRISASVSY
jgi:hypothetical protein